MAATGKNAIAVSGTTAIPVGSPGNVGTGMIVFEVSAASSLAMDVQATLNGSGTTPANCTYYDMLADPRTKIAVGTDITANGVYGVIAPGMMVFLLPSAGSCTVNWEALVGAAW